MPKKIAIFAPHSGIWIHSFPEAIIAETLKNSGNTIKYFYCSGEFSGYCSVMSSYGLEFTADPIKKNEVCKNCLALHSVLRKNFDFNFQDIKEYTNDDDTKKIHGILSNVNRDNFLNLEFRNIFVGKISLYQILLTLKKGSAKFSETEWLYFLNELKNTLLSLLAAEKIVDDFKPDLIITYNALYAVNNVWRHLVRERNIDFYFLHAGGNLSHRLQTMILAKDNMFEYYKNLIKKWPKFKEIPSSSADLKKVYDHLHALLKGQHFYAYSSPIQEKPFDVYDFFKIELKQKVFLACLSSNDERYAAELIGINLFDDPGLYKSQTCWINGLIDYFKVRPEYVLIIRVHPREFPNKRESVLSEHAKELKELFKNLPNNIKINWPSDNISIYQLATQIDVALTSWSSVGKELSLFGLPVITYCPNSLIYSSDLNYWANDINEYFKLFDIGLEKRFCLERVRKAYRWYVYEYHYATIDISDSFDRKEVEQKTIIQRIKPKLYRSISPHYREINECERRSLNPKNANQINKIINNSLGSNLDLLSENILARTSLQEETKNILMYFENIIEIISGSLNSKVKNNSLKIKSTFYVDL